jgi:hypothetical protein
VDVRIQAPILKGAPTSLPARVGALTFPNLDVAFAARLGRDHLDLAFAPPRLHSENAAYRTGCGADGSAHYGSDRPSSFASPGGSFFSTTNRSLRLRDKRKGGYDRDGKCTQYCIWLHDGSILSRVATNPLKSSKFPRCIIISPVDSVLRCQGQRL